MTLTEFEALLKTAAAHVYRYKSRRKAFPYLVWSEYRKVLRYADTRPTGGFWRVQVDYYTDDDADPAPERLEALLGENEIPFIRSVSHDQKDEVTRHIFDCEVLCG